MAKSSEKIYSDPVIGDVTFRKSVRSRSISIRVHPVKGVSVSVPYIVPYAVAQAFFMSRREWVLQTMVRQKERFKDVVIPSAEEVEAMRRQAKAELPPRLAELASRYGFAYNRVTIKHNATNWGSCSSRMNINLNLNIVRLPSVLRDYVLLHELCHLRHQDHGHAFHLLLEHVLTDNLMTYIDFSSGSSSVSGAGPGPGSGSGPASVSGSVSSSVSGPALGSSGSGSVSGSSSVSGPASGSSGSGSSSRSASVSSSGSGPVSGSALGSSSGSGSSSRSGSGSGPASGSASGPALGSSSVSGSGAGLALELARKAAVSRAKYPLDHVMTKAIKQYPLR